MPIPPNYSAFLKNSSNYIIIKLYKAYLHNCCILLSKIYKLYWSIYLCKFSWKSCYQTYIWTICFGHFFCANFQSSFKVHYLLIAKINFNRLIQLKAKFFFEFLNKLVNLKIYLYFNDITSWFMMWCTWNNGNFLSHKSRFIMCYYFPEVKLQRSFESPNVSLNAFSHIKFLIF